MIINPYAFAIAPAPPESPPVTSGLILWLDASQLAYSDGDTVAIWNDLSAESTSVVTELPGVMRKTGMAGNPGVDLSQGTGALYHPDLSGFSSAFGGTHFSVQNRLDQTTLSSGAVEISNGQDSYIFYSGYNYYEDSFCSSRLLPVTYTLASSAFILSPFVYSVDSGSGGTNSYFNGAPAASGSSSYTAPTRWLIGRNSNGYKANGLVSEHLAYNRQLTPTEIAATKAYLSAKWGTP